MRFILLSLLLFLASCGTLQKPAQVAGPAQSTAPALPAPEPTFDAPEASDLPLAWEKNHPERAAWSKVLRENIAQNLPTFLKASDWTLYCSKFNQLSAAEKIDAIATMSVAIALYESAYKPASVYHEPPLLGVDSIGLFQLSYEDEMQWCAMDRKKGNLVDPLVNIQCAIPEMAKLIDKDGVVAEGQIRGTRKGLARYWSTMWPKGHLNDIRKAVQTLPFCK